MEDQQALDILLGNIAGKPQAEPNWLRFVTGRRKKFWNKNVVALGLAAGFMEPLESTSIHLINTGIDKLISLLSLDGITKVQEDTFNRLTGREYARIRDFLILHYWANDRDEPFWQERRAALPDHLARRVALWRETGHIAREGGELFSEVAWLQVLAGQGVTPHGRHPVADSVPREQIAEYLDLFERLVSREVAQMPTHAEFLARLVAGRGVAA